MTTAATGFSSIGPQVAAHFNTTEEALDFEESAYFPGTLRVCTVKVNGSWFDCWFDESYKLDRVYEDR
jgi:hypothetical protein